MGQYTEYICNQTNNVSIMDDDYEQKLIEIAASFRDFGSALTDFLVEHGYGGDQSSIQEKANYLRKCYKEAGIKDDWPRDFKKWFSAKPKRETIFPLLFALNLNIDETMDFFRRVLFERGLDCHTAKEAIIYFCLSRGLSYTEAKEAINNINVKREKNLPKQEVVYTSTIVDYIDSVDDLSLVVSYICDNYSDFQYNDTTAIKFIKECWEVICGEDGLAYRESTVKKDGAGLAYPKITEINDEDRVRAGKASSAWTIYNQILGLDKYTEKKFAESRSLTSVFKNNVLLPLQASDCFPSRQSIEATLRGELGEHESFRKLLILLVFYSYCVKRKIQTFQNSGQRERYCDGKRCIETINKYLIDAGYPELYAGNPYEWIFLWSLQDEDPIDAFRFFIGEVQAVKSEAGVKN